MTDSQQKFLIELCESLSKELCFSEHISVISLRICNASEVIVYNFISLAVTMCVAAAL